MLTQILKNRVGVMSTVVETSRIPLLKIPRRFTFSEVAHARHNSSKLDSALTYSQHSLCRGEHCWVNSYIITKVFIVSSSANSQTHQGLLGRN